MFISTDSILPVEEIVNVLVLTIWDLYTISVKEEDSSVWTTLLIVIDLDKAQLIVDDVLIGTLAGSGDIYFGMYDGSSYDTGVREFYFSPNEFIYSVPDDATPWKF